MKADDYDYTRRDSEWLAQEIRILRANLSSETDDVVRDHLQLKLESVRSELSRRNEIEIRRRADLNTT